MARRSASSLAALATCAAVVLGVFMVACGRQAPPDEADPARVRADSPRLENELEASALAAELAQLRARVAELEAQLASARDAVRAPEEWRAELARLQAELGREQELRLEREREWLRYTNAIGAIGGAAIPGEIRFDPQVPEDEKPKPPEPVAVDTKLIERSKELERSLRTLLAVEGVRGVDLLEAGELRDGAIGPVVFRVLDERGRLAGSLGAQRLRLSGSRTARTLTIVLEDGFEAHGGVRTAFEPSDLVEGEREPFGVRRIELADVDPMPWVSAAPELFGGVELAQPKDDGRWSLAYVRATLNRLLAVDGARGYWRLKTVGGVVDGVLCDVHLEEFDAAGKLARRIFADRLKLDTKDRGVELLLEDGASVRGDEKSPFLDGRFRIYLPRADREEWLSAGLPGLSPAPKAAEANAGEEAPKRERD